MKTIGKNIKYIPATDVPLSAEVYFIEGTRFCYIYDVGNNDTSLQSISQIHKEKIVILSHYHKDHTGNIEGIHCNTLYVGNKTKETIGTGMIVADKLTIHDGVKIEIAHCISPHTDGSLIVTVDNTYTLIADLYFTRPPFDKETARKMIEQLKCIDTEYFVVSHQEDDKIIPKDTLIAELIDYFIR